MPMTLQKRFHQPPVKIPATTSQVSIRIAVQLARQAGQMIMMKIVRNAMVQLMNPPKLLAVNFALRGHVFTAQTSQVHYTI